LVNSGHVGGALQGAATSQNLLAVSEGGALVLYEVGGGVLLARSTTAMPMPAVAVVRDDVLLYVGLYDPTVADPNERSGLAVVDATDPAAPVLLAFRTYSGSGFVPKAARDGFVFGVSGELAYVDARDPAALGGVQRVTGTPNTREVAIAGDTLVAVGGSVWVVDLQPLPIVGAPVEVPGMAACACWCSLAINAPYAYVGGGGAIVSVIDVSQPAQPFEQQRLSLGISVGDVSTDGTRLFIAPNQSFSGFHWSDLANPQLPAAPVPVVGSAAWLDLVAWQQIPGVALGILPAGIGHVPVQNPQNATILDLLGPVRRVAPAGDRLCVATATGVAMARLANDGSLQVLGRLAGGADNVVVAGDRAYAIRAGRVDVLDIANDVPQVLGTWQCTDPVQGATALVVRDGLAFVVTGTPLGYDSTPRGGLWSVNVGDAANPTTLTSRSLAAPGRGIVVDGAVAYVTMYGDLVRLSVFDVAVPAAPVAVTDRIIDGYAGDLAVRDGLAYIATTVGLVVLDVSNLPQIQQVSTWVRDANAVAYQSTVPLALDGPHVFLGSGAGFDVLDVSTPSTPALKVRKRVADASRGLQIVTVGGNAFLLSANDDRGLLAFTLQ